MSDTNKKPEEPTKPNKDKGSKKPQLPKSPFNFYWIYGIILVVFIAISLLDFNSGTKEITWQEFETRMLDSNDVEKIVVVNKEEAEVFIKQESLTKPYYQSIAKKSVSSSRNLGPHFVFNIGSIDAFEKKLDAAQVNTDSSHHVNVIYETRKNWGGDMLGWLLPIALMIGIWVFIMRKMGGGGGGPGQIFNIGKSKAALFDADNKVKITFADVAGLEEAKEEIKEIVEFLKTPAKFTNLGGKIPKGALLVGPPGTGKTLLAKAVAGEAGVPFFSLSGSDFVEMFVGVGAARVRDLFNQAKLKAPSIIFIDEIDAVGRSRGKGQFTGANDERENTLNSLLVEMDGFGTNSGVIILAATNRPDVLDSALLRPGRFDRQISIDKPDIVGREAIFKVHLKPLTKLAADVNPLQLASQTPGFAGAEIANVCNEAALIAARRNKAAVDMQDFQDAIDRVIGGLEKKNKLISPEEKKIVAYHEAGHAVTGWFLEHSDPLVKVSIVPRGIAALGYAQYLPKEQFLYTTEQLTDSMCMALGGRAAEELIFGRVSTGALSDLERITKMAYSMVSVYGMNKKVGNISFYDPQREGSFTKPYSEATAKIIDDEARTIIEDAYIVTKKILVDKSAQLEAVAQELLLKEVLFEADLERLIGKRPFAKNHNHNATPDPITELVQNSTEVPAMETPAIETSTIITPPTEKPSES